MKASEIRDWDNVEIQARLKELEEEKFRLRFKMGTMELENPKMVQHVRRDVARMITILREREAAETEAAWTPEAVDGTEATDELTEGSADASADETPETEG